MPTAVQERIALANCCRKPCNSSDVQVTARVPAPGAVVSNIAVVVSVTFDRPIDPNTITPTSFFLTGPEPGGPVVVHGAYTFSNSNMTVSFTASAPLPAPAFYTVHVTSDIRAAQQGLRVGCTFAGTTWTFNATT